MAIDFDIDSTANALIATVQSQLKTGWATIAAFVTTQSRFLANQAAWIVVSRVSGALRNDAVLLDYFVGALATSTAQLARDVAALTILTLEKVWNAAVAVLWGALNKALSSAGLGVLMLPGAP